MIVLDFETRSRVDLKAAGSAVYVADPSTEIICLALADLNTGTEWLWFPHRGEPYLEMLNAINNAVAAGEFIIAHNAEFDQGIYEFVATNDYKFPQIPSELWYCSMAQCRVNNLPAALGDAAWALNLKQRKDHKGANLIQQLSIPQKDGSFNYDALLLSEIGSYCLQDVRVTVEVYNNTRRMTVNEHLDWLKNCEINERGVRVDIGLAVLALMYAGREQTEIGAELSALTGGVIDKHTQGQRVKKWLTDNLGIMHPIVTEMEIHKDGKKKQSLDKNIRRNILTKIAEGEFMTAPGSNISQVIELIDDGNKSSVAKFKRMLDMADKDDGRVRGAFVFAGASATLRYASRGLQLHNMRRDCWNPVETKNIKIDMMRDGNLNYGNGVMDTLSKLLRPALIPDDGKVFVVGDWSAIEAGVLPYLSNSTGGDKKLDLIESGADIYVAAAKAMGLGKDSRQLGKVSELACGFGGGWRAFAAMARNYGLLMNEDDADEIVQKWRQANYWAVDFWAKLERAAKNAIEQPLTKFTAGMITYIFIPEHIGGTLICTMPGDHILQYTYAKIEKVKAPWGDIIPSITALKTSYKPKADAKNWPRGSLYGGLLAENVTQGFAAAILRAKLRDLNEVVAHVHDEIVMEVSREASGATKVMLKSWMEEVPEWAEGLPLKAEPVIMERYGK